MADYEWDSESVYSVDDNTTARVSPLRIPSKNDGSSGVDMGDNQIFHGYCAWKLSPNGHRDSPGHTVSDGRTNYDNLHPESFPTRPGARNEGGVKATKSQREALYSPLTPFFADNGGLADRKGSKIMFGQNGWLEKTGPTLEKKEEPQKKSMLGGLKKIAKEFAASSVGSRGEKKHVQLYSTIAISLDPREQSLLYCELEFYLSCAIHGYITVQLNHGRLDPDKLKKIADAWANKGRPKVIGFRFDLETQIELIGLHIGDFRFYGRRQGNETQISGLLHTMKVNARSMRIRTFCQPDSVIAKQLVDAQSFFNLLGVPDVQQLALQQVAQFFKVILERERHRTGKHEGGKMPTVSSLVDSQWEKGGSKVSGKSVAGCW
ncbi:uncharacterized protein DNG_08473 [Cephalotrichum gorgonifer]|uniref:Uncharacterized protein n=1 Tax=Cephalotrichum gorgonifer TaxID=2041049 RepID=A0AAE8N3K9_9PEZI|nr:uncharacterized protein DNG_08473 [Cephalotrichum gorgonifer]